MSKNTIELPNLKEIEKDLFKQLQTYFRVILSHTLEELDVWLMENRDFKRFEYRERQSCTLETLFGPLTFKRRKYKDRQTGRRVALLDQVLKFKGSNSLSPLITDMAVDWAVRGRSYRDARDRITELLDHQAISHESIRQKVLGVKKIDHSTREGHPKKVKALFLEVDGINPSLQGMAQKTHEVKVGMVHEGWEKRHPKSKNYQLVNKSFYISLGDGEEFWEAFSRELYAQYDINEETPIIINGDGASWIRAGVDYFPNAFYNYDRFHLKKWMKAALSNREKKERQKAYKAAEANDPSALLAAIAEAEMAETVKEKESEIARLRTFILNNIEAFRDYRERLQEKGFTDTSWMRPMGAAESQMNQFSKRLKQGYSWGLAGLHSMATAMVHRFEGTLYEAIADSAKENEKPDKKINIKQWLKVKTRESIGAVTGHLPALASRDQGKPYIEALKGLAGYQGIF